METWERKEGGGERRKESLSPVYSRVLERVFEFLEMHIDIRVELSESREAREGLSTFYIFQFSSYFINYLEWLDDPAVCAESVHRIVARNAPRNLATKSSSVRPLIKNS